jgi:hypothetical protein
MQQNTPKKSLNVDQTPLKKQQELQKTTPNRRTSVRLLAKELEDINCTPKKKQETPVTVRRNRREVHDLLLSTAKETVLEVVKAGKEEECEENVDEYSAEYSVEYTSDEEEDEEGEEDVQRGWLTSIWHALTGGLI